MRSLTALSLLRTYVSSSSGSVVALHLGVQQVVSTCSLTTKVAQAAFVAVAALVAGLARRLREACTRVGRHKGEIGKSGCDRKG